MSNPVPVFLEWEIVFGGDYLKQGYERFIALSSFWDICIRNKVKITVNRMRAMCGVGVHPDSRDETRQVQRGNLYVYEDNPGDEDADKVIPAEVAKIFWQLKLDEFANVKYGGKMIEGGLTLDEMKEKFPLLAELAGV